MYVGLGNAYVRFIIKFCENQCAVPRASAHIKKVCTITTMSLTMTALQCYYRVDDFYYFLTRIYIVIIHFGRYSIIYVGI